MAKSNKSKADAPKNNNELTRFDSLPPDIVGKMDEANEHFKVGDMFYVNRYQGNCEDVYRVVSLKREKRFIKWDEGKRVEEMIWMVYYEAAANFELTRWNSKRDKPLTEWLEEMKDGRLAKMTKPFAETVDEAFKVISGEIGIDVYYHNDYEGSLNENTALIHKNSKESLQAIEAVMTEKKKRAELIACAVGFQMEKKKRELESVRQKLYGAVEKFMKQVKRIQRVITTIELYLGIDEEITQIQDGSKADVNTPITFRQRVLFIDEEVGIHEDGGLDWKNIEQFDEWLLTGNNIDIVLPEKKGMVVLRPRRKSKEYVDDAWANAILNIPNHTHTYFLIRNGECVYRIFTDKIVVHDRLFPQRKELQKLYEELSTTDWESERERKKEQMEDTMYHYRKRAVLMQGLIDRTEIFHPLPLPRLNIFNLEETEGLVSFIYDDDDNMLPDGRLRFRDWWEKINESIQEGSRVLITGKYYRSYKRERYEPPEYSERFYLAANSAEGLKNVPDLPKKGVYVVEEFTSTVTYKYRTKDYHAALKSFKEKGIKFRDNGLHKYRKYNMEIDGSRDLYSITVFSDKPELTIMYMPNEPASAGWNKWDTHDRKVRTRFKIYKDDDFIINYDQIELDDVEFYLYNRTDRPSYLFMMPLLKELRKHLIEEMNSEEAFKDLVFRMCFGKNKMDEDDLEMAIKESVNWWKFKNKWKRRISKDDELALRMIMKRVLSPSYKRMPKYKTY